MSERQVEIEDLLDLMTIACADLEAVREKIDNDIDRQAVSSQLKAMRSKPYPAIIFSTTRAKSMSVIMRRKGR